MKTNFFGRQNLRGSALLAAMIVITILSFAAAGILSYSLTTYRNSVRQASIDLAKELADSEMENLYFDWKSELLNKTPYANIETTLPIGPSTNTSSLQGNNFPFLSGSDPSWSLTSHQSTDWNVTRYLHWNQVPNTSDGSATGIMPGTVNEIGKNFYYTAKTSATLTSPLFGTITYHSGRHFVYSSTSLFQFAVFYEGNLELAPGSDMLIQGPIATNASAYLGTVSGVTLTLASSVYYFQNYEGAADPLSGETDSITSTGLNDPIYNPNPLSAPPDQATQRANQVQKLSSQASFIGDVHVGADVLNPSYAAAYTNPNTHQVDPNEIYRAVIAPPPTDSSGNLLTEDPLVKDSRMYNAAGILITINQASPTAGITVDIGGKQSDGTVNYSAYDADTTFQSVLNSGTATSVIGAPIPNAHAPTQQLLRYPIVDPREALNGQPAVNITTLDIGNLTTAITTAMAHNPTLAANYNGVVYVYDSTAASANTATQGTLNGILLKNATTTPNFPDTSGNPLGFTVVTNNGLYVQGDYNTSTITINGTSGLPNPAGIMGDAVTALSYGYDPTLNHYDTTQPNNGLQAWAQRNATTSPGDTNPYGMQIYAAILTGNTPTNTTVSPEIKSGGAQNLVRLIENWYSDPHGLELSITGSLGQLFSSDFFQGAWPGTGNYAALGNNPAYLQPHQRNFSYDLHFQQRTPAGSPSTTSFHKGNFFFW